MKNKCYLIRYSTGSYDDHAIIYKETAYLDPHKAEQEKDFLHLKLSTIPPFPFKCSVQEFEDTIDYRTKEEKNVFFQWYDKKIEAQEYNNDAKVIEFELVS